MDASSLSLPVLIIIFVVAAVAIWLAGIKLSDTTDALDKYFGLGEALGGLIILAIVTNLPELVIVVTAAVQNNMGLAIGNILGGIAVQTVVLVILDAFGVGKQAPLTYRAASLVLVLEAVLLLAVLSLVVMGHQMPSKVIFLRVTPFDFLILIVWLAGVKMISKAKKNISWVIKSPNDNLEQKPKKDAGKQDAGAEKKNPAISKTIIVFSISALVTLVAGVALEVSSDAMAKDIGMQGVLFGATVLAVATSLPEISTGMASVKLKDYDMAMSDIFGGNAFLPVLFFLGTLISGKAILPMAQKSDIYLTGLGMILTTIYIYGLIFRPKKQILRMGIDSLLVLIVYFLGIAGLVFIS